MNFKAIGITLFCALILAIAPQALAQNLVSHAPDDARVYIVEPSNGEVVPETFMVKFGLSGMDLAPAGVEKENAGHHHLLIDKPEFELATSLPSTEQIRHFGKAQTETELTLTPGKHTLQLILGNYAHVPHDHPVMSEAVTITVE